jgi:hypothetical protein
MVSTAREVKSGEATVSQTAKNGRQTQPHDRRKRRRVRTVLGADRNQRRPDHSVSRRSHYSRGRTHLRIVGTHRPVFFGKWHRCARPAHRRTAELADSDGRDHAGHVQRVLFRRCNMAPPESRSPPPVPNVRRIPGALLIVANGFLALVSIAALIGIWMAPG